METLQRIRKIGSGSRRKTRKQFKKGVVKGCRRSSSSGGSSSCRMRGEYRVLVL